MRNLKINGNDVARLLEMKTTIAEESGLDMEATLWSNKKGFDIALIREDGDIEVCESFEFSEVTDREVFEEEM